ncbi:MAG: exodeoxyribonuclease III [Eubacteriales bacterium]|nr:exodeoxyribonuclease III [Eubacteriales bacterium]
MKMISWNVNGLRACVNKGFFEFLEAESPDIIALQETKMQPEQAVFPLPDYHIFWNSAEKKGYSGTAIFCKNEPMRVSLGLGNEPFDHEGRVITLEYANFFFVNVYTPNSQDELKRLDFRMDWEDVFFEYLKKLEEKKPIIVCGDMNVAHKEIDLKNPKTNRRNPGFTDEERGKMSRLLDSGVCDSFRHFYPDLDGAYSWWSYRFSARQKDIGWRIDYFLVSECIKGRMLDAIIYKNVMGSDHCPVGLILEDEWN